MRNLNWDKELKKVQKRGLYNPKIRAFSIITIAVLTLGIGLTFSAFSYSSGDNQAFNSSVNKKVKVIISVSNGTGAVNTTINYQSSGTVEYSVTPNNGYVLDEMNTTCNYNSSTKKVIITPNQDVNCKVVFKNDNVLKNVILANNTLKTETPDFSKGEPPTSETNTGSGLYAVDDDDGISYYFRGEIDNNYVKFAEKEWRIIRINGDETIRIISEDNIGKSKFNDVNEEKYWGYTYDNGKNCTTNNPCDTSTGISSAIKQYLENWYQVNLNEYDSLISLAGYCNYKAESRINSGVPTLICPDTNNDYGGYYNLKIGLISADEVVYAGLVDWMNDIQGTSDNYLSSKQTFTMTPSDLYGGYYDFYGIEDNRNMPFDWGTDSDDFLHPVINLNSDVTISSGNGTKATPYVIQ